MNKKTYVPGISILIIVTILSALVLRLWGIAWSLPYVDHPDEPAIVGVMLRMVRGDLNPKHFFYPTFIMYLQALVFKVHFWWGHLTGLYPEAFELPNSTHFFTTIPQAFVWSRTITALLGTMTVAALALWSGAYIGPREGVLAAALLAGSAWAVIHDHYITVDGPSALFGLLALLSALQILSKGNWRDYLIAGILIGLAAGTKYQNVLVAASVTLAHILRWRMQSVQQSGRLIAAGGISALVFLATTPYIILAPGDFLHDIRTLFESYSSAEIAHGDVTGSWPMQAYLSFYWRECLQPVPLLLALVGIAVLVRRNAGVAAVIMLFPVLMVVSLLRPQTHFYRNLLPTLPPLLMLAGVGGIALLDKLYDAIQARMRRAIPQPNTDNISCKDTKTQRPDKESGSLGNRLSVSGITGESQYPLAHIAVVLGLVGILVPSFVQAVQASSRLAQPDSRVVAQEYIRERWPAERVASEISHPLRWNGVSQLTYVHYLPLHTLDWYRSQGFGVLVANSGRRGSDDWTIDYAPLLQQGQHVATFGGRDSEMLGPRIDLIDTGLSPDNLPEHDHEAQIGGFHLMGATVGTLRKQGDVLNMEAGRAIAPGRTLSLLVFWRLNEPVPPAAYTIFVHLRDEQGRNIVQRDAPPWQNLFPPDTWPVDTVIAERLDMWLPYEVPPGEYRLVMGLYDSETWARYPASRNGERLIDDEVDLGVVTVDS